MSSEKRILTRGLLALGVVVGAAIAAEPIFVTPPATEAPSEAPTVIDDLPVAKTWPADAPAPAEEKKADPQNLPVFVGSPSDVPKPGEKKSESAAPAPQRSPVGKGGGGQETATPAGDGVEPVPVPPESQPAPMFDVRLGLGLKPIKVDPRLPSEVGLVQTALAKAIEKSDYLPEEEAHKALCSEAGKIVELTTELSQTPLIEVTTHFTLWRNAMTRLLERTNEFERRCKHPSAAAVTVFKKVVRDFDKLLEVR